MVSMPNGQEDENTDLGKVFVVKETKSFVDVWQNPLVGVDVERFNQMLEFQASLKSKSNKNNLKRNLL